jgi:hypothetical protein
MGTTVEVTIPVDESAAVELRDAGQREAVGRLVSRVLECRRRGAEHLVGVMDRFATEARANGLTDEILDAELAVYNAELGMRPKPCRGPRRQAAL